MVTLHWKFPLCISLVISCWHRIARHNKTFKTCWLRGGQELISLPPSSKSWASFLVTRETCFRMATMINNDDISFTLYWFLSMLALVYKDMWSNMVAMLHADVDISSTLFRILSKLPLDYIETCDPLWHRSCTFWIICSNRQSMWSMYSWYGHIR